MLDTGYWMLDAGCRLWVSGHWFLGAGNVNSESDVLSHGVFLYSFFDQNNLSTSKNQC